MIAEVRQAIANAVSSRLPDMQCLPFVIASPTPPALMVRRDVIEFDKAMAAFSAAGVRAGTDMLNFTIIAIVAQITDQGSQQRLDAMCEPSGGVSIKEAVELDGSLGGLVDDASITTVSEDKSYQVEGQGVWLGAEFTVQVLAG